MIYMMHEMQLAASAPLRVWAEANHRLFSNPFSPLFYAPGSRKVAAGSELLARFVKHYDKPEWGIEDTTIDGNMVPVKIDTIARKPFCHLLRFKRHTVRRDPPVLVVAPLSGHYGTLLRDTVRSLIRDHDVHVTDWMNARMVPLSQGHFHLDDYVAYVQDFIRILGPDVHIVAVCQPTVPVLAAVSLMAANGESVQPRSMILMGGPSTRAAARPHRICMPSSARCAGSNQSDRPRAA